jgi:hypothetical protein
MQPEVAVAAADFHALARCHGLENAGDEQMAAAIDP